MVMVLLAHEAVKPIGKPIAAPMPVALMVACVMGAMAAFVFTVGELEAAPTPTTEMVPETVPQPPIKETV